MKKEHNNGGIFGEFFGTLVLIVLSKKRTSWFSDLVVFKVHGMADKLPGVSMFLVFYLAKVILAILSGL